MNRFILLSFILISGGIVSTAQTSMIPQQVQDSFIARYPTALEVKWNNWNAQYSATFLLGVKTEGASFSAKGELLKTEQVLIFSDLPEAVQGGFSKSKYGSFPIKRIVKIAEGTKGVHYRIIVQKGAVNKTGLLFSDDGILRSEKNFL